MIKKLTDSIFSGRMLVVLLMGFSSGLPLLLVGGTMKAWMRDVEIDLATIGFFSAVGLPYSFKFLWAPLIDRYVPPFLGRRRGWLVVTQAILAVLLGCIAYFGPTHLGLLAVLAVATAFWSATQDVVIDAYRREILTDEELGLGTSLAITGYRGAIYVTSGGAFLIAGFLSWGAAYVVMIALMILCFVITFFSPEPGEGKIKPPATLKAAAFDSLIDYFKRDGALLFLIFIFLFKLGDQMASEMLNPFYIDSVYTLKEIGAVAKTVGLIAVIAGGLLGGILMLKWGVRRSLFYFGILQMVSTAGFAVLAQAEHSLVLLGSVIAFENVASGMGTAAYAAFMASLTNRQFTGTQYALLTSFMGLPRVIAGSVTGVLAESLGWSGFFVFCTVIALPGLAMLPAVGRLYKGTEAT